MYNESEKEKIHRQQTESRLSAEGRKFFQFIEFDENEQLVTEIRKHPFGLFIILATGLLLGVSMFFIALFATAVDFSQIFMFAEANNAKPLLILVSFILLLGIGIMTYIGAFLYNSNVIFVTNEKIAQIVYLSLFNRKISQLSIGDVQDVTVTQKGILAHFFNYGTLVIETAGEQENYKFTYVPEPYQVSKMIVGAHERNLVEHGN